MDAIERIAVALEGILFCMRETPTPKRRKPPASDGGYCQAFEAWWEVYPRKVAKAAAYKAWIAAGRKIKDTQGLDSVRVIQLLFTAARVFSRTPKGKDPQFCPHPATWLNQGRYDDDPACWQTVGNGDQKGCEVTERGPDYAR